MVRTRRLQYADLLDVARRHLLHGAEERAVTVEPGSLQPVQRLVVRDEPGQRHVAPAEAATGMDAEERRPAALRADRQNGVQGVADRRQAHPRDQAGNRRRGEDLAGGEGDTSPPQPRDQRDHQQRVTTEPEEIVVDPDLRHTEHVGEHLAEHEFEGGGGAEPGGQHGLLGTAVLGGW